VVSSQIVLTIDLGQFDGCLGGWHSPLNCPNQRSIFASGFGGVSVMGLTGDL